MSVILISRLSLMEYNQYMANLIGQSDRRNQLAYAEEIGEARGIEIGEARGLALGEARRQKERSELLSLWESGVSLDDAKRKLGL